MRIANVIGRCIARLKGNEKYDKAGIITELEFEEIRQRHHSSEFPVVKPYAEWWLHGDKANRLAILRKLPERIDQHERTFYLLPLESLETVEERGETIERLVKLCKKMGGTKYWSVFTLCDEFLIFAHLSWFQMNSTFNQFEVDTEEFDEVICDV